MDSWRNYPNWHRGRWQQRRPWWPRHCAISGDLLWLQPAYCFTELITGPGPVIEKQHWCSAEQFLLLQLKGSSVSELLID